MKHVRSNLSNRWWKKEVHFMQVNKNRRAQRAVVKRKHAGSLFSPTPNTFKSNALSKSPLGPVKYKAQCDSAVRLTELQ